MTSLTIVYSTVYSDADQRKHQSSVSLAFVWGIHRWTFIGEFPHKWPVTRKMFPFVDVIMDFFYIKHYCHQKMILPVTKILRDWQHPQPPSINLFDGRNKLYNTVHMTQPQYGGCWWLGAYFCVRIHLHVMWQAAWLACNMLQCNLLRSNRVYMVGSCHARFLHNPCIRSFWGRCFSKKTARDSLCCAAV